MTETRFRQADRCADTLYRLCRHLDNGDYAALTALFAPDGRWFRQGIWLEGRQAMSAALSQRPACRITRHLLSNVFVSTETDEEVGLSACMTAYRCDARGAAPGGMRIAGPYSVSDVVAVFRRESKSGSLAELRMTAVFNFPHH